MKKKEIFSLIIATLILLFLIVSFAAKEKDQKVELKEEQEGKITQEEIDYVLSLPRGKVLFLGEDHFIIEIDHFLKRIKINITNETDFVFDSDQKEIIEIPEEYETWLSKFHYIKNVVEKEYLILLYFDTREDLGEDKIEGILDFDEVTAKYIFWGYNLNPQKSKD